MDLPSLYPAFFARLDKAKRCAEGKYAGRSWSALCPAHEDRSPSFRAWEGRDGRLMFGCYARCPKPVILAAMGLQWSDTFPPRERGRRRGPVVYQRAHEYLGAAGELLYRKCVVRHWSDKDGAFKKRGYYQRWDRERGEWVNGLGDVGHVLYRLPGLIAGAGRLVVVVEGEKDADTLAGLGFVATTAGGADEWRPEFAEQLAGRPACVIPDHDAPGLLYATSVVGSLLVAGCRSVRLFRWPDSAPEGWDVSDEVEANRRGGDSRDELIERVKDMVRQSKHWRAAS